MFEQTFVGGGQNQESAWTCSLSFVIQIGLIVVGILIPMI